MVLAIVLALFCGSERTQVKDLLDHAGLTEDGEVATVEALPARAAPPWHNGGARTQQEFHVVTVVATVVRWHREADHDLHVVIQGASGKTMIVELPDPACVAGSPYAHRIAAARKQFLQLVSESKLPLKVRISGVVFFDKLHGQDGVARNGVELHPVLSIEKEL